MVRSRKYALVTAALALILIAAVVLTVALVGNHSSIVPQQEASVAPAAAVNIGGSTGSVSADYVFQTLKAHSNKKGDGVGWDITEMQTDGSISYYPATLDNTFYLITQSGKATEANNSGAGVTATDSYYQVTYNGMNYRFSKNSGYTLYLPFVTFITQTNYSQNVNNYGMAVQASASGTGTISYDPRKTYHSYDFRATFDGAGVTLSMSNMLSKWDSGDASARYTWIQNGYRSDDPTIKNNVGLNCAGLLIASLYDGTLKNFKLTDRYAVYKADDKNPDQGSGRPFNCHQSVRKLSGHYYEENNRETGTAFGGLVGYAGPTSANQEANTNSYISNISLDFTKNVLHVYRSTSTTGPSAQVDMFTGAAIGLNMSANISNLVINMNSSVWDQCTVRMQGYNLLGWGSSADYSGTAHIGVLSGMMLGGKTLEKVAIYGTESSAFVCSDDLFQYNGTGNWSKVHTYIGGAIGTCMSKQTINGFLFSYPLANCWYPKADKRTEGATFKRGIFVGNPKGTITYSNVYLTDMVIANSTATSMDAIGGGEYTNYPAADIVNSHDQVESGDSASFPAGFWFDGSSATNKRFVYADEAVISSIQFSNDSQYMVEISAPSSETGVMWQVNYCWKGTTTDISVSNSSQLVFMQNARDNVKLRGLGVQGNNNYVVMNITYASSYNYELTNGPGDDGSADKVYDKQPVNYPSFGVTENVIKTGNASLTNMTIQPEGDRLTLGFNDGDDPVGGAINNFYNANGVGTGKNDISDMLGAIMALNYKDSNGEYVVTSDWTGVTAYDANDYRWDGIALFGVSTTQGNFVFVPQSGTSTEITINKRPIYVKAETTSVPYIGEGYALAQGTGTAPSGTVYYGVGTTATNGGEQAIISGDTVSVLANISDGPAVDVNTYHLSASGTLGGSSAKNYTVINAPSNENAFSVTPANVTLTVTGGSMPYGTTFEEGGRAAFMEHVEYTLDFGDSPLTGFAARDGITLNLNLMTTSSASSAGQYLFAPTNGSGRVFAYAFPAGMYDVVVEGISGIGSGNYNVTPAQQGTGQFEVEKLDLAVSLPEISDFTYGDRNMPQVGEAVISGLRTGDQITSSAVKYFTAEDDAVYTPGTRFGAGSYYAQTVVSAISSPGSVNGLDNYNISYGNPSAFDVLKRDTYVLFDYDPAQTYVYQAAEYSFNATSLSDGAAGDGVSDVTFAAFSDSGRLQPAQALNAGIYYPGATSATLSDNYNVLGVRDKNGNDWATFEIEKASVTLALGSKTTDEYSGEEVPFAPAGVTITVADALQEEVESVLRAALTFTYNGAAEVPVNAGTYAVAVSLPELTNYNAATASLGSDALTITQMTITITPKKTEVTAAYDGTVIPNLPYTITGSDGRPLNDEVTPDISYYVGEGTETVATSLRNVGIYTIVYKYYGATGNYASAKATVTYEVTKRQLHITLRNAQVTYNKQAYQPDYDITTDPIITGDPIIAGDVVNITFTVTKDGSAVSGDIVNAGEYNFTFGVDNANYALSDSYTVTIDPYTLTAQGLNSTLLFNAANTADEYYEEQMAYRVLDADGKDITERVTVTPELVQSVSKPSLIDNVDVHGGVYAAQLTIKALPGGYLAENYKLEANVYTVYVYRIGLRGALTTGGSAVTFGKVYSVKGELFAMSGEGKEQPLTLDASGNVEGIADTEMGTDVQSITVTAAAMNFSGVVLNGKQIDDSQISNVIADIFQSGVATDEMKNAGTYTATITITVKATYSDSSLDRDDVQIIAPFTWTVVPLEIASGDGDVNLGQLNKYYTETITAADIMGVVEMEYKEYVTAVSAAISGSDTYVNAGEYKYDLVLNTSVDGYYNFTLPAVETGKITGKINVQKLTLQVSAGNAEVEYGKAVTPSVTPVISKGETPLTEEEISQLGAAFTSQYSYTTELNYQPGKGVGLYEGAIKLSVTATKNFTVEKTDGNVNVIPRKIQITLGNLSMVYGTQQLPALTYTLTGGTTLFTGDDMPALATDGLTLDGEAAPAVNRINASSYAYDFTSLSSQDENYEITAHNGGTLTVTPYVITSVTWDESAKPVYKGSEFAADELFTIADMDMPNGDVVTFGVAYTDGQGGKVVKNAGAYTAAATVASVTNGTDPVEAGNYDVSRVATRNLNVAQATLTLSGVAEAAEEDGAFILTVTYDPDGDPQEISASALTFTFGAATYAEDNDGALTVTIAYTQNGFTASPVNAGTYSVSVTVSGANFVRSTFTNISLVINKLQLTTLDGFAEINVPAAKYTSQVQNVTLTFIGDQAGTEYTFTYYKVSEDGTVAEEPSLPIDAGTYQVDLLIDSVNVYYEGENEAELTIEPQDDIDVNASVVSGAGLGENEVYFTGAPIYPQANAIVNGLRGDVTQITIEDSAAFSFKFYRKSTNEAADKITINGKEYSVYDKKGQNEAIDEGDIFYVYVTFNAGGKYNSNYIEKGFWMLNSKGTPLEMSIKKGNMSVYVLSGTTRAYSGLVGYNGRDVIYQENGKWFINTEIFSFKGVDLAGMTDQMLQLKTGPITITVSVLYGYSTSTGEALYSALYDYKWGFDSVTKTRTEPVKTFRAYGTADDGTTQNAGPVNDIYDFGYANGLENAVYRITISVDNTVSGSSYSPAQTIKYVDGKPVMNEGTQTPETEPAPHVAAGTVNIAPAQVEFEMLYTSDFYNDGNDMLKGGYNELNDVATSLEELTQELLGKAQFILRGVAVPYEDPEAELIKITNNGKNPTDNVTGSNYTDTVLGEKVRYEVLDKTYFHLTVTNEEGKEVYTYNVDGYNNGSQNVGGAYGITNAGTYTFEFVFDGMNGKYAPFSYTWDFVQQAAEYHITVTQEEGVTLTTPFGTEFDLTTLNGALKATLEDGELATETGHYQDFEDAFKAGNYDNYITLFGDDGSGVPYTDYQVLGVESPVGQYYISYVFVSKDKNLEIMMETQESMIEVTATAPGFLADADGNPVGVTEGEEGEEGEEGQEQNPGEYNIGSVSYSAGNTQTEYVLSKVRLGLEYTTLPGNTNDYAPYTTSNVGISAIQYLADGSEDWVELPATSSIMSVGKYKIWFAADGDNNLEGSVSDQYVLFEITKINATAFLTGYEAVNGQTYTGYDFSLGWKITDESGLDVQAAVLGGEVNIMVKFGDGEFAAGGKINEAGTYTVYVTAAGSANYNVKDSEQVQIVINKADLNVRFAQSYYTAVYNENGNTIAPDQVSYELNGRRVSNAGGASDVYYLLMDEEGKVTNESAQQMVEAYLTANSELDLDEWAAQNGYTDFVFTSVGDAAAATDVGVYLPIVVYEGDGNYVKSARLITNGSYPEFEITKAAMQAILVASQKYVVTYGDAITDITSADTVLKHFTLAWKKQVGIGSDGSPEYADVDDIATSGAVITYSMLDLRVYTKGYDIGTYANAYELEINFSHKNYELDYQTAYTSVEVKPYAVSVDLANAQVYLEKDGADSAQALTAAGVTFNKVYQGASFGRLTFVFKDAEDNVLNTGFGLEGQNGITQEHGFGAYGVLSVAAADEGGFVAGTATIAGEYNTKVVFTLNNGNYTVTINGADGTLATLTPNTTQDPDAASYSVDVKMNVEKAVLRLLFDTVTYTWGKDGEYTETATPSTRADHVGWWEYSTIWTGYKFEESDRVYIQSGYFDGSGEFVPFGRFKKAARLGGDDVRNGAELALVIDYGDSGNLAAVGEYNIHISTGSANYVIANADNEVPVITVTPEGGGTPVQTQNNMIDINITIAASPALEVTAALDGDENARIPALFTQDGEDDEVWSRTFDGMTINSKTILGDYLAVYRYKRTKATVQGSIAAPPDATVQLERDGDRDFSDSIFASGINVTFAGADGTALDSIMSAGTYKMTVSVELTTNEVNITEYTLVIDPAPASNFTANVRNKARSSQIYNGEALVPNFTFTLAIAEKLNGTVVHTLDVTSYAVQVFKDGAEQPLLTYNVKNGVAELSKEQRALLANAGSYTFKLVVNSPNAEANATFEVNTSAGPLTFTIERRDLSNDGIDIAFKDHFDYTTAGGLPVAVDEERLELSIFYDRTLKLISGTDYTVTFENGEGGKYTGTYNFTVTGTGNFKGVLTGTGYSYSIGASVGLTQAPGSIVYGSDSVTVVLTVNSMDPAQGDGSVDADSFDLIFNSNVGRLVSGDTTVSQLTLVGEPVYADGKFTVTLGGLRAVNAGEYYLDLSFTCVYDNITSNGKINAEASGAELCKVIVTPASVEQAAESVSAVLTSVNSTSVTFNISGTPRTYEYSLDNGQTWKEAVKGNNVISALAPEQNVTVTLRVNDDNYATAEGVREYDLDVTLAATTTASVDDILTAAEELARSFNATGFTRYAELLQRVENISAADREARGAEIDEALAAVEEARSEYIEDLQGAIDSAVNAAERAAGKASATTTATAAATAGALSLPLFGIGMVFAARKRNKKEDDLND